MNLATLHNVNRRRIRWQPSEGTTGAIKSCLEEKKTQLFVRHWLRRAARCWLIIIVFGVTGPLFALRSDAQMGPEAGSELNGTGPMSSPTPSTNEMPAPIQNLPVPQPVHGSMLVSPPYGNAPLRVGFFVLATDPEGLGFLTYSWNFGDGTVSSLPPELYIFHTYRNPGSYVCELTTTTVDGRKSSFFQGVIVEPPAH
jgi:hypothetical protein